MYKMKKYILYVGILVVVLVGVGFWIWQGNNFSTEVMHMELQGPDKANIGEVIEYKVTYRNNGNFTLQNVKLTFRMPMYALTEDGKTLIIQDLGDLKPGRQESISIK